jgi:hypothetical protein
MHQLSYMALNKKTGKALFLECTEFQMHSSHPIIVDISRHPREKTNAAMVLKATWESKANVAV